MRKNIAAFLFICIFFASCSHQPVGWVLLHPTGNPPPLAHSGFAYNTQSNEAVVFGGITKDKWSNETWIWDGNWHKADSATKPPAREKVGMAYDESRNVMVIFGGMMNKDIFDDTWEWDGKNWKLINPIHKPTARCCHAMAYDSIQKRVLLYGGWNQSTGEFFNDTWEWDGKDWIELPSGEAPLTAAHTLVNFSSMGKVFATPIGVNNTWEWDGNAWHQINSHPSPPRADGRNAYDSKYGRVIFFGGIKDGKLFLNDTWIFNGQEWNLLNITAQPPARYAPIMFYDVKRQSVILYGGAGSGGVVNDTWELKLPQDLSSLFIQETPTP